MIPLVCYKFHVMIIVLLKMPTQLWSYTIRSTVRQPGTVRTYPDPPDHAFTAILPIFRRA